MMNFVNKHNKIKLSFIHYNSLISLFYMLINIFDELD